MLLSNFFKKLFEKPKPITCGGEGLCEVVDGLGRIRAKIWYNRPDSEMRLNYSHEMQEGLMSRENLERIKFSKQKTKDYYDIIVKKVALPYAEKIFVRSEGYVDEDGKDLADKNREEQLLYLKEYHCHNLADMVVAAFETDGIVKKKS